MNIIRTHNFFDYDGTMSTEVPPSSELPEHPRGLFLSPASTSHLLSPGTSYDHSHWTSAQPLSPNTHQTRLIYCTALHHLDPLDAVLKVLGDEGLIGRSWVFVPFVSH